MKTLLLFTGSYPFSAAAENTFIPQELTQLAKRFKQIVVVPQVTTGTEESIPESNICVNTEYAAFIAAKSNKYKFLLSSLFDRIFLKELSSRPLFFLMNPKCIKTALLYRLASVMTEGWIKRYFSSNSCNFDEYVLETWWFNEATLGLAEFSVKSNKIITVTRAHGYDLYEERRKQNYIPFRRVAINKVEAVFSASQAGAKYLLMKYPEVKEKIHVGLLGVNDPGFSNNPSTDGTFRILSCSALIPLKRIDLLILGLQRLGTTCKKMKFQWTHIGSGPEIDRLKELAFESLPENVNFDFLGNLEKKEVYDFYYNYAVDLFINVSTTEGTPVSIMEAISVGVPILATSVGGNKEIVGPVNGVLLPTDPSPEEIAIEISKLVYDPAKLKSLRSGSKRQWVEVYNAEINYDKFINKILNNLWPS